MFAIICLTDHSPEGSTPGETLDVYESEIDAFANLKHMAVEYPNCSLKVEKFED